MSLDDLIRMKKANSEPMRREEKLDLLKQTADGIAHLHHNIKIGIFKYYLKSLLIIFLVHRDVKPKNILLIMNKNVGGRIQVKISDFGLCKSIKIGHNSISKVSGVVGTEGWMAPELFNLDLSVVCFFFYSN